MQRRATASPDLTRELTGKGVRQAKKMAQWLDSRLPKDTRILSSPATRCQQTAEALGEYEETPASPSGSRPTTYSMPPAGRMRSPPP